MKKRASPRPTARPSFFRSRIIMLLALAMVCPMLLAYAVTYLAGERTVREQSARVLDFYMAEIEDALAETERTMDNYLLETGGSCLAADLLILQRYEARTEYLLAMGMIAPDGKIACAIGDDKFGQLTFPVRGDVQSHKIEFAELRQGQGSLPILIKTARDGVRIFSVVSNSRFSSMLFPDFMSQYAQIDLVLPNGGLWHSLTGSAIQAGFVGQGMVFERQSSRFPVKLSMVLDERAARDWAGDLRTTFIIIVLGCVGLLIFLFFTGHIYRKLAILRAGRVRAIAIEKARLEYAMWYQPIIDLDTQLLVGVVVRSNQALFDAFPEAKPGVDAILGTVWREIGDFAGKRREFHIVVEVEGEDVVEPARRGAVIDQLKSINYPHLTLLMRWPPDRGVDPDLYRPLEQVATAGANLAIDCGNVRFSMLSDMWAWPYHRLVVNFTDLPEAEDAVNWIGEIVLNMSEQLHIGTLAIGLDDKAMVDHAIGSGFRIGAGLHFGPQLTIEALMAAVRPKAKAGGAKPKAA